MTSALADEAAKVVRILDLRRQWFAERAAEHGEVAAQFIRLARRCDASADGFAYNAGRQAGHYGRYYINLTAAPMSEADRG